MADQPLPNTVRSWMQGLNWGEHHVQWHGERRWDLMSPEERQWAVQQGWQRAALQEGQAGNGFDFLLMHRAMLELLREQFPQFTSWFVGWPTPPTDPDDASDPVPMGNERAFQQVMLQASGRLTNGLNTFVTDDDFGLFIETSLRPTAVNPFARSSDPATGLHNYLHNRFSDASSPINMGDPLVNLENALFWKLHGWIDARWSVFRQARGLFDNDPAFRAALDLEKQHLQMVHVHAGLAAGVRVRPRIPASLRRPFAETLSLRFQRAMQTTPVIKTAADLQEYLQIAIKLEHFTLPPYLCALWSLQTSGEVKDILSGIVYQEMLHMGLACNILKAIGGQPQINTPSGLPTYPDFLPGVRLNQPIDLQPLSGPRIQLLMKIEEPLNPIPPTTAAAVKFDTIGAFYDAIDAGLVKVDPTFTIGGQIESFIGVTIISNLQEARDAIKLIKEQGEGTPVSQGSGELAHYYRLQQIALHKKYVLQPDGSWKLDSGSPLPFPPAADILQMAPVPPEGYPNLPEANDFDAMYTQMLGHLQEAWDKGGEAGQAAMQNAVTSMQQLETLALKCMGKKRPDGTRYGPTFRWHPPVPPAPASHAPLAASVRASTTRVASALAASLPGFARIKQILDDSVNHEDIGAHGAFWRPLSRDQFVAKSIFGRKLIAARPDGSFDPDESNLVRALEGRAPFGADLTPPPAGAIFNRMPDGFPTVQAARVQEIRDWIAAGCPDHAPNAVAWIDAQAGGPPPTQQHLDYWRDFDNWAMFNAVPPVPDDIDAFFQAAPRWLDFAKNSAQEPAWAQALTSPTVQQAIARLETRQRDTVTQHYGKPVPLLTLLDSLERFGDDSLPNDPQRPQDQRHNMNGAIMWFMWSAFIDGCLRLATANASIPAEFWNGMARVVQIGLINDGLFRSRFSIAGFTATPADKAAAREYVLALPENQLPAELARRYRESGL